ncbi:MAG: S9 family peptidase [Acidimicrobiia bacterium]|nr:S9 family peptidase [Acidimicrobiia bacterium]
MQLDDLARFVTVNHPSVAPDGSMVVVATSRMNLEEDRYDGHLWVWDGSRTRQITAGPTDVSPVFAPDGRRIAFLRKGPGKKDYPQLALLDLDGGEPLVLTDFARGVQSCRWLPDGSGIVIGAADAQAGWADLDEAEADRRPRRVTKIPFRFDTIGWTHNREPRIWLVDATTGEMRRLTSGDFDESAPAVHPDGSKVAFLSDRSGRKVEDFSSQVWEVDLSTGAERMVVDFGMWSALSYRPDGVLHGVGLESLMEWPDMTRLFRFEDAGPVDLTAQLDRGIPEMTGPITWRGDHAVVLLEDAGRVTVIDVAPDGTVRHLRTGDAVISGAATTGDGSLLAFTQSWYLDPGELWVIEGAADARPVTTFNETFRGESGCVVGEHFMVASSGHDIDAWVYMPPGLDPVPMLLNIHGGPAAQYGYGFFDEFQMYVAAGYGVVCCNPRGSSGRGTDHVRAVTGDGWGVHDLADIQAVVAAAADHHDRLDVARMGVMGGSYGGFMTAWLTGHDNRFRSAVVERALLSWVSFAGTSDIGSSFPEMYTGASLPDDVMALWDKSPLAVASRTDTPTLIIHSENDYRCPIEQAEQYLSLLLRNDVEAELLRFPAESHELSRSGKPRHRRERFEAILAWHAAHLAETVPDLAN